jgi:streptomycin 6-kinase
MLIKWRPLRLMADDDLRKALHRTLSIFAEAAGRDPSHAKRWAQFHAVQAVFWNRRHGASADFAYRVAALLAT